ncbi:MAG: SAM-dependent DNA methyltransferase [SAR324 cluster bacterium]|nr:SAM-dependent DNA methyltransferase [SAR324 cluster bacterium]
MEHSEISSLIWKVCDDELRGLFKPHEYGDIILPFLLLRRIDCVLEPHKDKVIELNKKYEGKAATKLIQQEIKQNFFNSSKYDLNRLKQDSENIKINFNNYLAGYSDNILGIIENFQLQKPIDKLNKAGRLLQFITKFGEINLHPETVSNHQMGQIFEELLRLSSEMSNETSGEHYTPRDVVNLLTSMVFSQDRDNLQGASLVRSIFDPCCGTGGMLTIGKEWAHEHINNKIKFNLFGQELNPQTHSICQSDMLIAGESTDNIKQGSSLTEDKFSGEVFDYMLSNPPYGVSWKSEKDFIKNEGNNENGRFSGGTPRISDGQLLFLQHMISKMEPDAARIGIVLNGSPLFTGDAGSGESNIRKWIIENDMLECIVSLPNQLFFNTGIPTYIWILTNKKEDKRKGKVQLINGASFFNLMRKALGNKRKEISPDDRKRILQTYLDFEETEHSKIFDNNYFGYTKITIEQPKIEKGEIVKDGKGQPKPDTKKRDEERVPLSEDIDAYIAREVTPHLPDAWWDETKDKIGYEISFNREFFKYVPLRSLKDIKKDLLNLDQETKGLLKEILK